MPESPSATSAEHWRSLLARFTGRRCRLFTIVVCAESLREIEQTAKARYPGSSVRITFPIEPECFFASGPHTGAHTGLEAMEGLTNPIRPS
jgi:hypothetical protein